MKSAKFLQTAFIPNKRGKSDNIWTKTKSCYRELFYTAVMAGILIPNLNHTAPAQKGVMLKLCAETAAMNAVQIRAA